jgi:2-polyprenyl-6-methoxyphenol hydroxylase-like FAD-dependent oxidoreductase
MGLNGILDPGEGRALGRTRPPVASSTTPAASTPRFRYAEWLTDAGALASIRTVGDSYDNAMAAESVIRLSKTECVRHDGPFPDVDDLELGTSSRVYWFNTSRPHSARASTKPGTGQSGSTSGTTTVSSSCLPGCMGWRAPELLRDYLAAGDRYFDAVSRVRVPGWSRGRVVLLGDAASCVSLFGEGSSSAIAGVATLAELLIEAPQDVDGALQRYQTSHEALTRRGQRGAAVAAHLLIPATSVGITVSNRALRLTDHR